MPIPCRFNPMGKSNKPTAFELVVKPGILSTGMSYGFTPYWGEWDKVKPCYIDWGDGETQDTATHGQLVSHTYANAGTYKIKIKADITTRALFSAKGANLVYDCSDNFEMLGTMKSGAYMFNGCKNSVFSIKKMPNGVTDGDSMFGGCSNALFPLEKLSDALTSGYYMFSGCKNALLPLTYLPEHLTWGDCMFYGCTNAQLPLTSLPDRLANGNAMFYNCKNAEINLDTLVANAPADGWTNLTTIQNMFNGCSKVTGSRSAFLAKCPNVTKTADAFTGTNTTE